MPTPPCPVCGYNHNKEDMVVCVAGQKERESAQPNGRSMRSSTRMASARRKEKGDMSLNVAATMSEMTVEDYERAMREAIYIYIYIYMG